MGPTAKLLSRARSQVVSRMHLGEMSIVQARRCSEHFITCIIHHESVRIRHQADAMAMAQNLLCLLALLVIYRMLAFAALRRRLR